MAWQRANPQNPRSPAAKAVGGAMAEWAIEVQGLHKRYGAVHAVRGLDLQVRRGEVFGLLGPNGAGKTSSLEMLEGLLEPDAGQIRLLGLDYQTHAAQIRERVGVQFQSTALPDRIKVREVLQLYAGYYRQSRPVRQMLELVQLQDKAEVYQSRLSGGQRQRLTLALALIHDPELVFLDEPTTGLDPQARQTLWDLVRGLREAGKTVLLTTHYMEEAESLCDRVGIMDQGRILQVGTPQALIQALGRPSVVELELQAAAGLAPRLFDDLQLPIEALGDRWSVALAEVGDDLQRLLSALQQHRATVRQLSLRRVSLEDVFLHVTGRSLRE